MTPNLFSAPRPKTRFIALLTPSFAIDRRRRGAPDEAAGAPLVLYTKEKGALRVFAGDAAAEKAGVHAAQPLAEARALCSNLAAEEADPAADKRAFRRLALGLTRYSPFVGTPETGAALLDATGVAHLFGGEAALLAALLADLSADGIAARAAIADTAGAAHAAAFAGASSHIIPPGGARAALADLPIEALRLDASVTEGLRRLGLKRIGALYPLPRAPLVARFGPLLLRRLDQALGAEEEPIAPLIPPPDYFSEVRLLEPISTLDAIEAVLSRLVTDLERRLAVGGLGARRFELLLFGVDRGRRRIVVGAGRPLRNAAEVARLFRHRIETVYDPRDAGFGYEAARLCAFATAPLSVAQHDAFAAKASSADALSTLEDRLASRLGEAAVARPVIRNAHLPEKTGGFLARHAAPCAETAGAEDNFARRPFLLFPAPQPITALAAVPDGAPLRFFWRRVRRDIIRAAGPERLAAEWRGCASPAPTRDYYSVEDEDGRRYWLFREGLYGRETAAPKWFLHGIFA